MCSSKIIILSVIIALFNLFTAINAFAQGGWQIIQEDSQTMYTDMCFVDRNNGWIVGYSVAEMGVEDVGMIIHTGDGGQCWEYQTYKAGGRLFAVDFTDSLHGWVLGYEGVIRYTNNGGKRWETDSSLYQEGWHVADICFIDTLKGWAIGNSPQQIWHTKNGGKNWVRQYYNETEGYFSKIFFVDSLSGWVSDRGKILQTQDGGKSWIKTYESTDSLYFKSIDFINRQLGWIVGVGLPGNIILRTSNGGLSWDPVSIGSNFDLGEISFADSLHGWIAGGPSGGDIFYTNDSGINWNTLETGMGECLFFYSIYFVDSCTGWAWGRMLCSDDSKALKFTCSNDIVQPMLKSIILPDGFQVLQNYPNPFNFETKILFFSREVSRLSISIYDTYGRLVKSCIDNEMFPRGFHEVKWDGRDQQGNAVSSGVYLGTFRSKRNVKTIKLVVIK